MDKFGAIVFIVVCITAAVGFKVLYNHETAKSSETKTLIIHGYEKVPGNIWKKGQFVYRKTGGHMVCVTDPKLTHEMPEVE